MNKKIIFLIVIIIASLFIGMSYGLWQIVKTQEGTNQAISKCFSITMSEDSSSIKLTKAYPISNEEAKSLTPYTFTISNNCPIAASYKINLETLNTSNIDLKFLRVSINNSNSQIINNYIEDTPTLKNISKSNTILVDYLAGKTSKTYDFRIWLDYNTTQYDLNNDGTDKWAGKITVQARAISDQELLAVCKSSGGDFIVDGECRKFYVKQNNFILNGNFKDGAYGWYKNSGTFVSYDNELLDMNCTRESCGLYQYSMDNAILNHEYYLAISLKSPSPTKKFDVGLAKFHYILVQEPIGHTSWQYYSYKFLYSGIKGPIIIYGETEIDIDFYVKNPNLIDLTLMFGEGYEPSQEWCDANLNSYFDYDREGTLIPISDLGYDIETGYYDIVSLT